MNTDNLPILSGYWEKIDALNKQLETYGDSETQAVKPKSSLDELTEAYTESVFGNTQDDSAWNTTAPVVEEYSQSETANADDVVNRTGENGQTTGSGTQSGSSVNYYINPDDYDSDEEYAKALMAGVRDSMQNGEGEAF